MRTRTAAPRIIHAALVALVMLVATSARADNVGALIKQLDSGSDKVRLAAALNLARNADPRAIPALSKVVNNDDESDVRRAAVIALTKIVTANKNAKYKSLAVSTLRNASSNDPSSAVRQQAASGLAQIGGGGGTSTSHTPTPSGGTCIYVNVGPMSSKVSGSNNKANQGLMVNVTNKTLGRKGPHMSLTSSKGCSGFYIDGTLNELKSSASGSMATLSCKISMLLADFPNKSVFGFLSGGAQVQCANTPKEIALASQDCISAVVEDLIAKKIVPTICTKTQATCP